MDLYVVAMQEGTETFLLSVNKFPHMQLLALSLRTRHGRHKHEGNGMNVINEIGSRRAW